jgi:hypothetical protein
MTRDDAVMVTVPAKSLLTVCEYASTVAENRRVEDGPLLEAVNRLLDAIETQQSLHADVEALTGPGQ